ncbi:hypothetical protein TruAng_008443 [Truncatella angustata]|nr:hypothetical protein TruAng_008443 [Truncatella angustata]
MAQEDQLQIAASNALEYRDEQLPDSNMPDPPTFAFRLGAENPTLCGNDDTNENVHLIFNDIFAEFRPRNIEEQPLSINPRSSAPSHSA